MLCLIIETNDFQSYYVNNIRSLFSNNQICNDIPVLITSAKVAELIKLHSDAFLALKVAFFNEIDTYAEIGNLDSRMIIE